MYQHQTKKWLSLTKSETDLKEEKGQVKCDYGNTKSVDGEFENCNGTYHLSLMIATT